MSFTFDLAGVYFANMVPDAGVEMGMTLTEWNDLWAATVTARATGSVGAISGRWKATRKDRGYAIYEVTEVEPTPAPEKAEVKPASCSACGSAAVHHVEYVRKHGLCIV